MNKSSVLKLVNEANIQIPFLMSLLTEQKLLVFLWKKAFIIVFLMLCCVLGFWLVWPIFFDHSHQIKQELNVTE